MSRTRSAAVLLLLVLTGCSASPPATESPVPSQPAGSQPAGPRSPAASSTPQAPIPRIDTSGWTTHVSERYGFEIGHPPDWRVEPSRRAWTMDGDAGFVDSTGQERFVSPTGDAVVTAWAAPYTAGQAADGVQSWAEQYCIESLSSDCATIGERAVRLCNQLPDCHPGLLVPFSEGVQAFFTGGEHEQRMVAVAVWRPPSEQVEGLGTAREVLDAVLSTMDVWPQP